MHVQPHWHSGCYQGVLPKSPHTDAGVVAMVLPPRSWFFQTPFSTLCPVL
ncbi:MAG: hypothetical protein ACK45X_11850 [Roseiflexaceae bacterium]